MTRWGTGRGLCAWALIALLMGPGCAKKRPPVEAPAQAPPVVLQMAQSRPIPDPLQARYSFRIRSERLDLAGSTNGVLIVDRPGNAHLALLAPIGGPVFTLSSDGAGVSVVLPRDRRHLVSPDAQGVLNEAAGGFASLDDLFGLLVGDLPLDDARVVGRTEREDEVHVVLDGPNETVVVVVLDPALATPKLLQAQRDGQRVLSASWAPFQEVDGALLPTEVALEVPALDLRIDLRYRSWRVLEEVPDVFGLGAPAGFSTGSLEEALRELSARLPDQAAVDDR